MIKKVAERAEEVRELCRKYGVLRLEIYSYFSAEKHFDETESLDFLVEFQSPPTGGFSSAYFGLEESLSDLFNCPVYLTNYSAIKSPYLRQLADQTRELIYGA